MKDGKMNMIMKFIHSLYRFESYPRFVRDGAGSAMLYLVLLALVFGSISYVAVARAISGGFVEFQAEFARKGPEFTFSNGELKLKDGKPYVLEDKNASSIVMVDTSGKTTGALLDKYAKGVVITRTHVYYKKNQVETREYDLQSLKDISFDKSDVSRFLGYGWVLIPLLYVFYIFSYWLVGKLITALLLAIIGLIISSAMKLPGNFEHALTVAIYAMTVPILIDTVVDVAGLTIPSYWLIYTAVAVGYMIFAFRAIKKTSASTS